MVNDELPNRIACGSVQIKPDIRRFLENGVEFGDGTEVKADIIVLATGYVFGFPYLDKEVLEVRDNVVNLFKYAFPPDLHPSTLVIIGCIQPWGAIMPLSELQCRWAAQVFKVRKVFLLKGFIDKFNSSLCNSIKIMTIDQ